MTAYYHLNK